MLPLGDNGYKSDDLDFNSAEYQPTIFDLEMMSFNMCCDQVVETTNSSAEERVKAINGLVHICLSSQAFNVDPLRQEMQQRIYNLAMANTIDIKTAETFFRELVSRNVFKQVDYFNWMSPIVFSKGSPAHVLEFINLYSKLIHQNIVGVLNKSSISNTDRHSFQHLFGHPVKLPVREWRHMQRLLELGFNCHCHPQFLMIDAFQTAIVVQGWDLGLIVQAGFPMRFAINHPQMHAAILGKVKQLYPGSSIQCPYIAAYNLIRHVSHRGIQINPTGLFKDDPILNLCQQIDRPPPNISTTNISSTEWILDNWLSEPSNAVNLRCQDAQGETALTQRLSDSSTQVLLIQALIQSIPELVTTRTSKGELPVDLILKNDPTKESKEYAEKKLKLLNILLKAGAKLEEDVISLSSFMKLLLLARQDIGPVLKKRDFSDWAKPILGELFLYACRTDNLEAASIFLASGAEVTVKDHKRFSAFKHLFWNNQAKYLQEVIEGLRAKKIPSNQMFDILNIHDRAGNSILTISFFSKEYLESLLKDYPELIKLKSSITTKTTINGQERCETFPGESVLHYAIRMNHKEKFGWALSFNADINALLPDGSTPLQHAVRYQRDDFIVELYKREPMIFHLTETGETVRSLAFRYGKIALVSPLREGGPLPTTKEALETFFIRLCTPNINKAVSKEDVTKSLKFALEFHLIKVSYHLATVVDEKLFAEVFASVLNPNMPMNYWLNHLMGVDAAHLKVKVEQSDLPVADASIDINHLVSHLESIIADDPAIVDPNEASRKKLIDNLKNYINCVINRTPKEKIKKPQEFYPPIHNALRHLTTICSQMTELKERAQLLKELATGAGYCETRWYNQPIELYNVYHFYVGTGSTLNESLENLVLVELMRVRAGIIDDSIAGVDTHRRMRLRTLIGQEINIPGTAEGFEDHFRDNLGLTKEQALAEFQRYYFPGRILLHIKKFLEERHQIEKTHDTEFSIFEWFKRNIPGNYKKREFDAAKIRLAKFEGFGLEQKDLDKIADRYDVILKKKRPLAESIDESRYLLYRNNELFEHNYKNFKIEPIVYLLTRLGIIREHKAGLVDRVLANLNELETQQLKKSRPGKDEPS